MASSRYGITAKTLISPRQIVSKPLVVVEDGRIESVASRKGVEVPGKLQIVDFPECVLVPGFVDIHIHGGAGHDVMEGSPEALAAIERQLARRGVTGYFPTTVTAAVDTTLALLEKLEAAIEKAGERNRDARAQPLGIHLEGPFISHAKCGVHPLEHIQPPSLGLFERMWQAAGGKVGFMTVAPELPGIVPLIAEAARCGVCVSLGHSDSGLEAVDAAIAAGARHATHTFNAMRPLDHRAPGILGAVLSDPSITADIIADGIHVHPRVVRMFVRARGTENTVLITDAISATGMGDGRYRLGSMEVEVTGERCVCDGRLAGSVLTLERAIRNAMSYAGLSMAEAVGMATLNPARVAGVAERCESGRAVPWKGAIEAGADADMAVISEVASVRGELAVVATVLRGTLLQAD